MQHSTPETWEDLLCVLEDSYSNYHEKTKKKQEFKKLEQGDAELFDSFYAKFSNLAAYTNLTEEDKIELLCNKLNNKFCSCLAVNWSLQSLAEYVEFL